MYVVKCIYRYRMYLFPRSYLGHNKRINQSLSLSLSLIFLCSLYLREALRESYPHHFLDQSVPFGHQTLRGLAQCPQNAGTTFEAHSV